MIPVTPEEGETTAPSIQPTNPYLTIGFLPQTESVNYSDPAFCQRQLAGISDALLADIDPLSRQRYIARYGQSGRATLDNIREGRLFSVAQTYLMSQGLADNPWPYIKEMGVALKENASWEDAMESVGAHLKTHAEQAWKTRQEKEREITAKNRQIKEAFDNIIETGSPGGIDILAALGETADLASLRRATRAYSVYKTTTGTSVDKVRASARILGEDPAAQAYMLAIIGRASEKQAQTKRDTPLLASALNSALALPRAAATLLTSGGDITAATETLQENAMPLVESAVRELAGTVAATAWDDESDIRRAYSTERQNEDEFARQWRKEREMAQTPLAEEPGEEPYDPAAEAAIRDRLHEEQNARALHQAIEQSERLGREGGAGSLEKALLGTGSVVGGMLPYLRPGGWLVGYKASKERVLNEVAGIESPMENAESYASLRAVGESAAMAAMGGVARAGQSLLGLAASGIPRLGMKLHIPGAEASGKWLGALGEKTAQLFTPRASAESAGTLARTGTTLGNYGRALLQTGTRAAIDLKLILPTLNMLSAEGANFLASAPAELRHAQEDWAAAIGSLADPQAMLQNIMEVGFFGSLGVHSHIVRYASRAEKQAATGASRAEMERIEKLPAAAAAAALEHHASILHGRSGSAEERREHLRQAIESSRELASEQEKRALRHNAATAAALQTAGYTLENRGKGTTRIYFGAKVSPITGKVEKGENYIDAPREKAEAYLASVMREKLQPTADLLSETHNKENLIAAMKKRGAHVEYMRGWETLRKIEGDARKAKGKVKELVKSGRTREEAEHSVEETLSRELTLKDIIEREKSWKEEMERYRRERSMSESASRDLPSGAYIVQSEGTNLSESAQKIVVRIAAGEEKATVSNIAEELIHLATLDYMSDKSLPAVWESLMQLRTYMSTHSDPAIRRAASSVIGMEPERIAAINRQLESGNLRVLQSADTERCVQEALAHIGLSQAWHDWARGESAAMNEGTRAMMEQFSNLLDDGSVIHAFGLALADAKKQDLLHEAARDLGIGERILRETLEEASVENTPEAVHRHRIEETVREIELLRQDPDIAPESETDAIWREDEKGQRTRDLRRQEERTASPAAQTLEAMIRENPSKTRRQTEREAGEKTAANGLATLADAPGGEKDDRFNGWQAQRLTDPLTGREAAKGYLTPSHLDPMERAAVNAAEDGLVRILRRKDGKLEAFSGQEELQRAKTLGLSNIESILYEENAQQSASWALTQAVENALLQGRATPQETIRYIRGEDGETPSRERIEELGLTQKGHAAHIGYIIGSNGSNALIKALEEGEITVKTAYTLARQYQGDDPVLAARAQEKALAVMQRGGSLKEAVNAQKERIAAAVREQNDLADPHPATLLSFIGQKARTAHFYRSRGQTVLDPADGREKIYISSREAKLKPGTHYTLKENGELHWNNIPREGYRSQPLGDLLDFPELYEAYPELREIKVRLYRSAVSGSRGAFFMLGDRKTEQSYIAVNAKDGTYHLSTLLHEIQHYIQSKEGWARGAASFSKESALLHLEQALAHRRESLKQQESAWDKANLDYLQNLQKRIKAAQGEELHNLLVETYLNTHGEQEARLAGSGDALQNPVPTETIAVLARETELAGVTFNGGGKHSQLINARLHYRDDLAADRLIEKMKETIERANRQLRLTRDDAGTPSIQEAESVILSVMRLLPEKYRYAIDPYLLWNKVFGKLAEKGNPEDAALPATEITTGWAETIRNSLRRHIERILDGTTTREDRALWEGMEDPALVYEENLRRSVRDWEKAHPRPQEGNAVKAWEEARLNFLYEQEAQETRALYRQLGEAKQKKLLSKYLDRASVAINRWAKDAIRARINRALGSAAPKKKGKKKLVAGKLAVDDYQHLQDIERLLNMTPSETALAREIIAANDNLRAEEPAAQDTVTIHVTDNGRERTITTTRGEFLTYGGFEEMSLQAAQNASRHLGEYISSGRQAWENRKGAQKQQLYEYARPMLTYISESERIKGANEDKEKLQYSKNNSWFSSLLNDSQTLNLYLRDPRMSPWVSRVMEKLDLAHTLIPAREKETAESIMASIKTATGLQKTSDIIHWWERATKQEKTGILKDRSPRDTYEEELQKLITSFESLLRQHTDPNRNKNFNPNLFRLALQKWIVQQEKYGIPRAKLQEIESKFGHIRNTGAQKEIKKWGDEPYNNFLQSIDPKSLYINLVETARRRSQEHQQRAIEKRRETIEKAPETAALYAPEEIEISRARAAYYVLLGERGDAATIKNLHNAGYTPSVLEQLRDWAGEEIINVGYNLRDKLAEDLPLIRPVFEKLNGVAFPEVANYYPVLRESPTTQKEPGQDHAGSIGTTNGWWKSTVLTDAPIDATADLFNAFAHSRQDHSLMLSYGEAAALMRGVMNYRERGLNYKDGFVQEYGEEQWANLQTILLNMQRTIPLVEETGRSERQLARAASNRFAAAILPGRLQTIAIQFSGICNALGLPGLTRAMFNPLLLFRSWKGLGASGMNYAEMKKRLSYRVRSDEQTLLESLIASPGGKSSEVSSGLTRWASRQIEKADLQSNVIGSSALYELAWNSYKKQNPELSKEELDALAMNVVYRGLSLKSQPIEWRQKSLRQIVRQSGQKYLLYFLGGENMNTFGRLITLYSEWRNAPKGQKLAAFGRLASVWLMHGVAATLIKAGWNYLADDEKTRQKRSLAQYGLAALAGPLSSIPIVTTVGWGLSRGLSTALDKAFDAQGAASLLKSISYVFDSAGGFVSGERLLSDINRVQKGEATPTAAANLIRTTLAVIDTLTVNKISKARRVLQGSETIANLSESLLRLGENAWRAIFEDGFEKTYTLPQLWERKKSARKKKQPVAPQYI